MRKINYRVEESKYPDNEGNYILVLESETERGCNYQRVFKGNKRECYREKKRRLGK
jgi:hypothetical protein